MARTWGEVRPIEFVGSVDEVQPHEASVASPYPAFIAGRDEEAEIASRRSFTPAAYVQDDNKETPKNHRLSARAESPQPKDGRRDADRTRRAGRPSHSKFF